MNDRSQLPPKFSPWLAALRDGTIEEHDFAQLSELLEQNAEARRYYVEYMQLAAILGKRAAPGTAIAETTPRFGFLRQAIATGKAVAGEPARRVIARGADVLSRPRPLALVVASVVTASLVMVLAVLHTPRFAREAVVPVAKQVVAKVTGSHETHWGQGGLRPVQGQDLALGEQLQLQSGFVEITFGRGTRVVVEGPATLALTGDNSAVLDRGRLSALVPKSARGFTVTSPVTRLTDLGTEFGVVVNERSDTEVYVFQGKIAAEVLDPQGRIVQRDELSAGHACCFSQQGLVTQIDEEAEAKLCGARFVRNLPKAKTRVIGDVYTSAGDRYIVVRHLQEGSLAYVDRPSHRWSGIEPNPIPAFLQDAEYVAPANDHKGWPMEISVTLLRPAILYVLFDDRVETPDWLKQDFVDTGADIGMNESAELIDAAERNGKTRWTGNDRVFSIFKRVVSQPGTIVLDPVDMAGTNMYTVAAVALDETPSEKELSKPEKSAQKQ